MMSDEGYNPYAPPEAPVAGYDQAAEAGSSGEAALADRASRLLAKLADGVSVAVPLWLLGYSTFEQMAGEFGGSAQLTAVAVGWLVAVGVVDLVGLYRRGQTIGKWWMGIQIVRSDRESRAALWRILLLRAAPMGVVPVIPYVGALVAGFVDPLFIFTEKRRCLHDYLADTAVVLAPPETASGGDGE